MTKSHIKVDKLDSRYYSTMIFAYVEFQISKHNIMDRFMQITFWHIPNEPSPDVVTGVKYLYKTTRFFIVPHNTTQHSLNSVETNSLLSSLQMQTMCGTTEWSEQRFNQLLKPENENSRSIFMAFRVVIVTTMKISFIYSSLSLHLIRLILSCASIFKQ